MTVFERFRISFISVSTQSPIPLRCHCASRGAQMQPERFIHKTSNGPVPGPASAAKKQFPWGLFVHREYRLNFTQHAARLSVSDHPPVDRGVWPPKYRLSTMHARARFDRRTGISLSSTALHRFHFRRIAFTSLSHVRSPVHARVSSGGEVLTHADGRFFVRTFRVLAATRSKRSHISFVCPVVDDYSQLSPRATLSESERLGCHRVHNSCVAIVMPLSQTTIDFEFLAGRVAVVVGHQLRQSPLRDRCPPAHRRRPVGLYRRYRWPAATWDRQLNVASSQSVVALLTWSAGALSSFV